MAELTQSFMDEVRGLQQQFQNDELSDADYAIGMCKLSILLLDLSDESFQKAIDKITEIMDEDTEEETEQ